MQSPARWLPGLSSQTGGTQPLTMGRRRPHSPAGLGLGFLLGSMLAVSRMCPPKTQTQADKPAGKARVQGHRHSGPFLHPWPQSRPRLYFLPAANFTKTQLTLLLIEQFCADRREDWW